jgi:hypothetical protein
MNDHGGDVEIPRAAGAESMKEGGRATPRAAGLTSEIVLNWTGFFVGLLVMTIDYIVAGRSINAESWAFLKSPKAMVWIFFVAGQFALWATVIEPLWRWRLHVCIAYGLRQIRAIRAKVAVAIIFFALPGLFLVYVVPDSKLAHHDFKMGVVNVCAVIVALVAVSGIWYVRAALESSFVESQPGGGPVRSAQEKIEVLGDLRTHLQRFISLLGAMVALATLAKGALRQAILATGGSTAEFPPEYVLLQGAYFSALLALVYIPTYTLLARAGDDIVDSIYPVSSPDLDWGRLRQWHANRKSLEDFLELKAGAIHNFRASIAILAPAATSVMAVLLGAK